MIFLSLLIDRKLNIINLIFLIRLKFIYLKIITFIQRLKFFCLFFCLFFIFTLKIQNLIFILLIIIYSKIQYFLFNFLQINFLYLLFRFLEFLINLKLNRNYIRKLNSKNYFSKFYCNSFVLLLKRKIYSHVEIRVR